MKKKNINYMMLRQDLLDYYQQAVMYGMPMAQVDVENVLSASDEHLLEIAEMEEIDLEDYSF